SQQIVAADRRLLREQNPERLVVGLTVRRVIHRQQARNRAEQLLITPGENPAPGHHLTQPAELYQADWRPDIRPPEVEAQLGVVLDDRLPAAVPVCGAHVHAVLAQSAEPGRDRSVPGGEHATFARGDELARVEGKRGELGTGAYGAAPVRGPGGAGRV